MDERTQLILRADLMLRAVRDNDSAELRRLLGHGDSPEGFWDERMALELEQRVKEHSSQSTLSFLQATPGWSNLSAEVQETLANDLRRLESERKPPPQGPLSQQIPLHLAAESGAVACLRLLLESGADPNRRDDMGRTPLFVAATPDIQRILVEAGVDLTTFSNSGNDALQEQLELLDEFGNPDEASVVLCRHLIELGSPLVCARPPFFNSRLYDGAFRKNLSVVRFLLEAGHPIDADENNTALHAICWQYPYPEEVVRGIVRTLLEAGISPNSRAEGGKTPLHEALSGDGPNLIAAEELLAAGAEVNALNDDDSTPLHVHYETQFDYLDTVALMLKHGANPMLKDKHGQTVLDIARNMAAGEEPLWRVQRIAESERPLYGWKGPAEPGSKEMQALAMLERAAEQ